MMMNYGRFFILILSFLVFSFSSRVYAASKDAAISEIMFDPAGSDTGLEYIVIKNFGTESVNLNGWDLYPDGMGYFTFPNFALESGSAVKIHLRKSGADDANNLYHVAATGNMGNSSGSVALFNSTNHSKDTIISFARYQKPESGEKKTWESSAAEIGIWTAGSYIDISNFSEDQYLNLEDFANKNSASGWSIKNGTSAPLPSGSSENTSNQPNESLFQNNQNDSSYAQNQGRALEENKIKAYAGFDRTVIAGSDVFFEGAVEGVEGEAILNARFLWNFGDGSAIKEGKRVTHVFSYPGNYITALTVASGDISALHTVKIAAMESPLRISEIKTGADGWVEFKNDSNKKIEISNFGLNSGIRTYYFPLNTFLSPYAFLAVASSTLGFALNETGELAVLYPNGKRALSVKYEDANLKQDESLSLINNEWMLTRSTPGEVNQKLSTAKKAIVKEIKTETKPKNEVSEVKNENLTASVLNSENPKNFSWNEYIWLFYGAGAGLLGGLAYVFVKRYFPK